MRFSDDTAMLALLNDFASYQSYLSSVVRFSSWCSNKFLHLNVSKKKNSCYSDMFYILYNGISFETEVHGRT